MPVTQRCSTNTFILNSQEKVMRVWLIRRLKAAAFGLVLALVWLMPLG